MTLNIFSVGRLAHRIAGVGVACLVLAGCGQIVVGSNSNSNSSSNKVDPQISWTTPAPISYGTALSATQLNANASVPGAFTYTPSLGTVPPAGSQTLSVTFTPTDTTTYATTTTSVTLTVNPIPTVVSWAAPSSAITYGTALSTTQLNATASVPGTFTYTPSLGAVLPAGPQTLSVTFTPTDTNYAPATASVQLTVAKATLTVTANSVSQTYGMAIPVFTDTITGFVNGDSQRVVSGAPALATAATLSPKVAAYPISASQGTLSAANYVFNFVSGTLTITQVMPTITWEPTALIAVNAPLSSGQLNATATSSNGPVAGTFVYSPAVGYSYTTPGTKTLSATFTPTDTQDYATPPTATINMNASVFGVAAWGDSLTSGEEGTYELGDYPNDLRSLITLPVVNLGVRGNTSSQIAVREGSIPTYATVAGGVIPASGGVTVTFPQWLEPVTPEGPAAGTAGTILGVHGVVTMDSTGTVYTFTRSTPGSAVSAPGSPQFVVDTPYADYLVVIWAGRNNIGAGAGITSDVATMVATVPLGQDYLVMNVISENREIEWINGPNYQTIIAINNQLQAAFGTHYLDIWKILVNSYDPTLPTDVSDFNHYEVPTSLRAIDAYDNLRHAIGATDTTITLGCAPGVGAIITIDPGGPNAENVVVTVASGTTMTVQRAFGGTNIPHTAGAPVTVSELVHLNEKGDQVIAKAVAQYLSAYAK